MRPCFSLSWYSAFLLTAIVVTYFPQPACSQSGFTQVVKKTQTPSDIFASCATPSIDTLKFHHAFQRLHQESWLQGHLNIDTLVYYGQMAIQQSQFRCYPRGYIRTCILLGWAFNSRNYQDSSIWYHEKAREIAYGLPDTALYARATIGLAWSLLWKQSYDTSERLAYEAAEMAQPSRDTSLIKEILYRQVHILIYVRKLVEAYSACTRHLAICEKQKDTSCLIQCYHQLEAIYNDMGLTRRQMDAVHHLLRLSSFLKDTQNLYTIYRTASGSFLSGGQYDSAIFYARLNLPLAHQLKKVPLGFTHLAKAFLESGQLDSARYYYETILRGYQQNGNYIETDLWLDLSKIEFLTGHDALGLYYLKKAEADIFKPQPDTRRDIYKALYEYYDRKGQLTPAFYYLKQYQLTADTIARYQNSYRDAILYLDQEATERDNQIQLLSKDNQLKTAINFRQQQEKQFILAGGAFLIILSGVGFYRFKRWRDLKQKEKLLQERLRISRDLHDEVGGTLSGVTMYGHLVRSQLQSEQFHEAEKSVTIIQDSTREMVDKLSDIVWLIHPTNDTLAKVFEKLGAYGQRMSTSQEKQIEFRVTPLLKDLPLPVEIRRHVYLIFKEGITNSIKYSGADQIHLSAGQSGQWLTLILEDNGKGFDSGEVQSGNGLRNMKQRAHELQARFSIHSQAGTGTTIELSIPLPH